VKGLFGEVGRHYRNDHHNDAGDNAALNQAPVPAILKDTLEHEVDQWQCTTDHIRNSCGRSGTQVGTELLRTHRHKYRPEAGGEAHHPTDQVHGTIVGIEWTEE